MARARSNVVFTRPYAEVLESWRATIRHAFTPEAIFERFAWNARATYPNRIRPPVTRARLNARNLRRAAVMVAKILLKDRAVRRLPPRFLALRRPGLARRPGGRADRGRAGRAPHDPLCPRMHRRPPERVILRRSGESHSRRAGGGRLIQAIRGAPGLYRGPFALSRATTPGYRTTNSIVVRRRPDPPLNGFGRGSSGSRPARGRQNGMNHLSWTADTAQALRLRYCFGGLLAAGDGRLISGTPPAPSSKVAGSAPFQRSALTSSTTAGLLRSSSA